MRQLFGKSEGECGSFRCGGRRFGRAGGDIIIAKGMNGMGKGVLNAKGNVVAKFLENATVTALGYVSSESILHSTVMQVMKLR